MNVEEKNTASEGEERTKEEIEEEEITKEEVEEEGKFLFKKLFSFYVILL